MGKDLVSNNIEISQRSWPGVYKEIKTGAERVVILCHSCYGFVAL